MHTRLFIFKLIKNRKGMYSKSSNEAFHGLKKKILNKELNEGIPLRNLLKSIAKIYLNKILNTKKKLFKV